MKEIDDLMKLVGAENRDAATALLATINSNIENTDKQVVSQESLKLDAIKTRDSMKAKYKGVLDKLNVSFDGVTDEKLDAGILEITGSGNQNDKALIIKNKEIAILKQEINTSQTKLEEERMASTGLLRDTILERDIATILPKYDAKANATGYITDTIKKEASFLDGKLVFKDQDGTTRRVIGGGRDMTLDDVVKGMQVKERESNESMFFNVEPQRSGAGASSGGAVPENIFD